MAARRLRPYLSPTPLRPAYALGDALGVSLYIKLESAQPTGSFKVRGALNKLLRLQDGEEAGRPAGIITSSSGNHGQAVAWAAHKLKMSATVVIPRSTPSIKAAGIERFPSVRLIMYGRDYDSAEGHARHLAASQDLTFISPFSDPDVVAGQGVAAMEILRQLPETGTLIVPVGGGGLLAGAAIAARAANPRLRLVGVQPVASCPMAASFRAGKMVPVEYSHSLADAVIGDISADTFEVVRRLVDDVVAVDEEDIARAMFLLLDREHLVAEGAGALPLAALLRETPPRLTEPVVLLVSGANVEGSTLARVLTAHLAASPQAGEYRAKRS